MQYPTNYTDELFERYISALIGAKAWQTIAAQYMPQGGISAQLIQDAHKLPQQALEPLLNEYKQERRNGVAPEQALEIVLVKMPSL
jgi:hypothetical protein